MRTAFIAIPFLISACVFRSGPADQESRDTVTQAVKSSSIKRTERADALRNIASVIAGTADSTNIFSMTVNGNEYAEHKIIFDQRWQQFETERLPALRAFSKTHLAGLQDTTSVVFYPFSGPDLLYPMIFFPVAKKLILLGLEPAGTVPSFSNGDADTLRNYFGNVRASLDELLRFSFFMTVNMRNDLGNLQVNGVLHLFLLFIDRSGGQIISMERLRLDPKGSIVTSKDPRSQGLRIAFVQDGRTKELIYLQQDLSDGGLRRQPSFLKFMDSQEAAITYIKGASYLLHRDNFSLIRKSILLQSKHVLQDDSGIPMKYFLKRDTHWSMHLFGEYTRPIPLFRSRYQKSLDSLYRTGNVKSLRFGLGYNFNDKNSNLMLLTRQ